MTLTLLHISDIHCGPPFVPHVAEALVELTPRLDPDVVVASGDFTQRAKPAQFAEAARLLERLGDRPVVPVPGNHDVPLYRVFERLFKPRDLYRRYIHEALDHAHRFGHVHVVALDSTSPRRCVSNGRIHLDQLAFAERAFAEAGDDPNVVRVLVTHHHLCPAPDYERDQTMPKARRALDRFVAMGVDLILGGHLHRAYTGNSLDVYPGANREHGIIIVQSGTTTSRRGRGRESEKNTFNLVRLNDRMIVVTHFMYFEDERMFAPISRHEFPRPGRRFREQT